MHTPDDSPTAPPPTDSEPLDAKAGQLLAALGPTPEAVADALRSERQRRPSRRALALAWWLRSRLPASIAPDLDVPSPGRLRLLRPDDRVVEIRLPQAVRAFLAGRPIGA